MKIITKITNYFKKLINDYEEWMNPLEDENTKIFNCRDLIMVGKVFRDTKNRPSFVILYPTIKMVIYAKDDSAENKENILKLRDTFRDSIGSHAIVTMKPTMNCYMNYEYKPN